MAVAACEHAPPPALPEQKNWRLRVMKKNDLSEFGSNLLIFGSVSLAFAPFLLGDRLILVVSGLMQEAGIMLSQFTNYVHWLIS
jgi:hypothetical protein